MLKLAVCKCRPVYRRALQKQSTDITFGALSSPESHVNVQPRQFNLDSPKVRVKHGHPGPSISGAAEQEVLPDGHVTDE